MPLPDRRPEHLRTRQVNHTFGGSGDEEEGRAVHIVQAIGGWVAGNWIEGTETRTEIDVVVASTKTDNSSKGVERSIDRDGVRTEDMRIFWTHTAITPDRAGRAGDEIEWPVGGSTYLIVSASIWGDMYESTGVAK